MENILSALSTARQIPQDFFEKVQTYHKEILENPEQSRQKSLILTVALTVIAAAGTGIAIKMRSLTSAAFTPLISYSVPTAWLILNSEYEARKRE